MSSNEDSLRILIADDSDTDRLLLQAIIKSQGHIPLLARDGLEAIDRFQNDSPDIILLDAIMPNMDGFETARFIKSHMGDRFIPIIFLTSLHDAESLAECLEAGGDDFLSKPYHNVILRAKINAFRRMQTMHTTLAEQKNQIADYNQRLIREQQVAKLTFDKVAHEGALQSHNIEYSLSPMAIFNGDVLLAAMHPNGDLCVLLGDFTGHGLAAAIGAMPLSQTFYSMVAKGFSIRFVAREINKKLKEILPVGVFCCASIFQLNFHQQTIEFFNAAMPDMYLIKPNGEGFEVLGSEHLALGILPDAKFNDASRVMYMPLGSQVLAYSDGVIEAFDADENMFGAERLQELLVLAGEQADKSNASVLQRIKIAVDDFSAEQAPSDDLSIVAVSMCSAEEFIQQGKQRGIEKRFQPMHWRFSYEIAGESLKNSDPTPVIQKLIQDAPLFSTQMSNIYTVLSELYVNALDHGVLGLDSQLKNKAEGFTAYYQERMRRLEALDEGFIRFEVDYDSTEENYHLTLRVSDSGDGFDVSQWLAKNMSDQLEQHFNPVHVPLSGRGLSLVKKFTDSLQFYENGSVVEVRFSA